MGAGHVDGEESQTKSCTRGAVTEQDLDTGSEVVVPQVEAQPERRRLDRMASTSVIVIVSQGIVDRDHLLFQVADLAAPSCAPLERDARPPRPKPRVRTVRIRIAYWRMGWSSALTNLDQSVA